MTDTALVCAPPKILIVDDNPEIVKLLAAVIEMNGYDIFVARDGMEALSQIEQVAPDLVILDLGLPKLSGEEVCRSVRRTAHTADLPVIMLSGKADDADRIIGRVLGADHYLTKPCDPDALLDIIEDTLREHPRKKPA